MLFLVLQCGVKCREKVCPLLTCCWNVFYVMALTKWAHKHRGSVGCICVTVFVSVLVFVSVFVFMQSGLSHVEEVGGLCRRGGEHLSLRLRSPLLFPPHLCCRRCRFLKHYFKFKYTRAPMAPRYFPPHLGAPLLQTLQLPCRFRKHYFT